MDKQQQQQNLFAYWGSLWMASVGTDKIWNGIWQLKLFL